MAAIVLNQLLYRAKHDPEVAELIREQRLEETGVQLGPDEASALLDADIAELARLGVIPNLLMVAARIHAIPASDLGRILAGSDVDSMNTEDEER